MKEILLILILTTVSGLVKAQFGVSYHQSSLPFFGLNYEINHRVIPEFRAGIDNYFDDLSFEFTISYIFKKQEYMDAYAGIGGRVVEREGLVVPAGLNIYPFDSKKFGFNTEVAGLIADGDLFIRGSLGIRYRFNDAD